MEDNQNDSTKKNANTASSTSTSNMTTKTTDQRILAAKEIINKFNKDDGQKIDEGIKYLENIKPTLPLPRTISGRIEIVDNTKTQNNSTMTNSGLLVSISGISNPAEDKEENEKDYSCYTDPDGKFTIAMPDKYNMQETITISVSKKNDMTYANAGQNSSHKVEFVKLASEVLKNEYLLTIEGHKKNADDILYTVNEISEKSIQAKEIEKKLNKIAYCECAKIDYEQKKATLEEAINAYKETIVEDVNYHIENSEKDIEKVIKEKKYDLDKIVKAIDKTEFIHYTYNFAYRHAIINSCYHGITPLSAFLEHERTDPIKDDAELSSVKRRIDLFEYFYERPLKDEYIRSVNELDKASVPFKQTTLAKATSDFLSKLNNRIKEKQELSLNDADTQLICLFVPTARDFVDNGLISNYKKLKEKIDDKNTNYYSIIKYYKETFLPSVFSLFQDFYTNIKKQSSSHKEIQDILEQLTDKIYNEEQEHFIARSLEELGCDFTAYNEITQLYEKAEALKNIWKAATINAYKETFVEEENNHIDNSEKDIEKVIKEKTDNLNIIVEAIGKTEYLHHNYNIAYRQAIINIFRTASTPLNVFIDNKTAEPIKTESIKDTTKLSTITKRLELFDYFYKEFLTDKQCRLAQGLKEASVPYKQTTLTKATLNFVSKLSDRLKGKKVISSNDTEIKLICIFNRIVKEFIEDGLISNYEKLKEKIDDKNTNYYNIIKYYKETYLPCVFLSFQNFHTSIKEQASFYIEFRDILEQLTDNTYYEEQEDFINRSIEGLGCEFCAYDETSLLYEKSKKAKEMRETAAKKLEIFKVLESEHISRQNYTDPYEDVIDMLLADCILLNEKVEDYKNAKDTLQKINKGLDYIEEVKLEFEKSNINNSYYTIYIDKLKNKNAGKTASKEKSLSIDKYAEELYDNLNKLIFECQKKLNELPRFNNREEIEKANSIAATSSNNEALNTSIQIERYLLNFLSTPMDSEFEDAFVINQSDFEDSSLHPRALPSVKLMGDGKNEVYLPTDTAPSRMFNYTMVHRLVEPQLKKNGIRSTRYKLDKAVGIHKFKEDLYNYQENLALASTLGIGYALNMHQAWVPDGFALGSLLYSLVLAPGEEQRLIVREHKEDYSVSDDANAVDRVHDSYSNSQVDNETAAFNNAVSRFSTAHSDSAYSAQAKSSGKTRINFFQGIGASSSATSTNSGSSYANSSQRDAYDEASHAAQSFQTSIKTESERIASANRTSIRVASSEESEAVSSRIIANHNHSHVMTVQYWEVAKRYRLETCIDGIELLLFVPLELIRFMPDRDYTKKEFGEYTLQIDKDNIIARYNKQNFEYRYKNILKYYDTIEAYVPVKYRSGLNLIKKFAALPYWGVQKISSTAQKYYITITGGFCEFDNLTATIYFNNGSRSVQGILTEFNASPLTKSDGRNPHTRKETIEAITNARRNKKGTANFVFTLPYGCCKEDISQIKIYNNINSWKYTLSKAASDMDAGEQEAITRYEQFLNYNTNNILLQSLLSIFSRALPECYSHPEVSFSSWELRSFGDLEIKIKNADSEIGSGTLGYNALNIYIDNTYPTLRLTDIQKIEETFHHIVSDTMYYSQAIWSSLSDDERIILLEPYTIEIDNFNRIASNGNSINNIYNKTRSISLLNCVNAKNVVGFYGNCMMLPFTFPKELAELIGKTAGDIQDELYRYHASNFRVPSTVVSIPTDGMVGEAVLGATNVSEKIDITRFWNWKDSDIDHIDLNQSSLNGRSLLENASTRDIEAPTVGVTPTEHVNGNNLAAALIARQQPTFADVYQNTDMRDLMKNADNNASAGREQIIKTNAELTKAALDAAVKAGEAAMTGGASGALGGGGGALSGSSLTSIVDTLGKLGFSDKDILKSIKNGNGTAEGIFKAAASLSKGTSNTPEGTTPKLTNALKSFGGEELKNFLSKFANNATNGQTLEESFKNSFSNITESGKNITINDILDMSNKFCSENNINLSDFTSELGKALGLF